MSKWKGTMDEEYLNLCWSILLGSWCHHPQDERLSNQSKSDGLLKQSKLTLIVKGYTHVHGFYYNETFTPMIKHDSIWSNFSLY